MCMCMSNLDALGVEARQRILQEWSLRLALVCGCQVWIGQEDEAQEGLESLVEWTMAVPPFWVPAEVEVGTKLCQMGMNEGQRGVGWMWAGVPQIFLASFVRSSCRMVSRASTGKLFQVPEQGEQGWQGGQNLKWARSFDPRP